MTGFNEQEQGCTFEQHLSGIDPDEPMDMYLEYVGEILYYFQSRYDAYLRGGYTDEEAWEFITGYAHKLLRVYGYYKESKE